MTPRSGSDPNVVPIPVAAHELLTDVLKVLKRRHSRRDLNAAAAIVKEATDLICQEVFLVPFEELHRLANASSRNVCERRLGFVDGGPE